MKQVSNAIKSFFLSSPRHHSIPQGGAFSKYFLFLSLAGIALLADSCQKSGNHQRTVPLKGSYTYDLKTNSGTGTASHIGSFSIVEPNNSVVRNADGSLVVTGTAIITAANGDQIFATHSGLVRFNEAGMAQVDAEFTITGGTGRFNGATGIFKSNRAFSEESYTIDGTISY